MANLNIEQVYMANPSTTAGNNDLFYLGQSPFGAGNDSAIKFSDLLTQILASSGQVSSGTANQLAFYSSSGTVISGLTSANSAILNTSSGGVPSWTQTLPSAVQGNITTLGTQAQALNMGGFAINAVATPVVSTDAVNKAYADSIAGGLNPLLACQAATTANLNATYVNGVSGVGATLTNAGSLAAFVLDGYTASSGDRILVKNQSTSYQNGIYTVTTVGSGAVAWVLTRATDYNEPAMIQSGDLISVENGTANLGTSWLQTSTVTTIGSSAITFSAFFQPSNYLAVANNLSDVASASSARSNLGLAIGTNVQAYNATLAAVAAGTYTGASSITTLGTIAIGTWQGSAVGAAYGGSGLTSLTAYALLCGGTSSTGNYQQVAGLGSSGQVLTSNGAGALPTFQTAQSGKLTWQYIFSGSAFNAVANNGYILASGASVTLPQVSAGSVGDQIIIIWNNNTTGLVKPHSGDVINLTNNAAFTSIQWNGNGSANFQQLIFTNATSGNWSAQCSGVYANWLLN